MATHDLVPKGAAVSSSSQRQIVGRLIAALRVDAKSGQPLIGRGNLAALRRMDPDRPTVPAFWRLLAQATEGAMVKPDVEARWALVAHGMALMAPNHHGSDEIGTALQKIDYAEGRLARLLNARGVQFRALVPRLCRHLAAHQQPLDWYRFATLVLAEGRGEDDAEQIRLRIARYYYQAQSKSQAEQYAA